MPTSSTLERPSSLTQEISDGEESSGFVGWDHERRSKNRMMTVETNDEINSTNDSFAAVKETMATQQNNNTNEITIFQDLDDVYEEGHLDFGPDDELESNATSSSSLDEKWSLSVRLNSAVDLPSSIIPSTPLCPLMKFGLITVTKEDEICALEKSSAKSRRAQYEQEEMKYDYQVDSTNDNNNPMMDDGSNAVHKQESLRILTDKGVLANFQNDIPLEECITSSSLSKPMKIQLTSSKIMSKKVNGMMEWHEDMRWDDIELPLQTVLCIELSARAVFPPSLMSAMETLTNEGESVSVNDSDMLNTPSSSNGGILNFWRKGRRGKRGNLSTVVRSNSPSYHGSDEGIDLSDENLKEMEKAAAAAAVARYLMDYKTKNEANDENDEDASNDNGEADL